MGDGNFHFLIVLDPNDPDEVQRVHSFTERLARYFYLISFSSFALLQLSSEAAERDLAAAFVYIVSFVLCSNQYQDYFLKCLLPFGERLLTMTDIEGLVSGFVNNKGPTCLHSLWVKCSLCRIQWTIDRR